MPIRAITFVTLVLISSTARSDSIYTWSADNITCLTLATQNPDGSWGYTYEPAPATAVVTLDWQPNGNSLVTISGEGGWGWNFIPDQIVGTAPATGLDSLTFISDDSGPGAYDDLQILAPNGTLPYSRICPRACLHSTAGAAFSFNPGGWSTGYYISPASGVIPDAAATPEPGSIVLLAAGIVAAVAFRRLRWH